MGARKEKVKMGTEPGGEGSGRLSRDQRGQARKRGLMALKGSKRVGLFEEESSWLADELRLVVVGG